MIVGAIPVKERSTRFPNKNFSLLSGKSLILRAIERLAPVVDEILITTDAVHRVESLLWGYEHVRVSDYRVPIKIFNRDPVFSDDAAHSGCPVMEMISKLNYMPEDIVVMTQVTTPLLSSHVVYAGLNRFFRESPDLLVAVRPDYAPCGGLYIFKVAHLIAHPELYAGRVALLPVGFDEAVDVDYFYQLSIAEALERGDVV